MENAIEIENLVKTYKKARGVSGISLNVEKGDFYGFIGPNGAGKSTTIRSMLGLIQKNSGTIRIFNKNIESEKVEILRNIGYMPSEAMFYPRMRVSEVIQMAANAYRMDCSEKASELCERLKVDVNKRIEELSLGNRKKISIVCAMQHKPDLYIFDEPTSGLDPLMQKEFFSLLSEVNKSGATIFLSSHVLSEIQNYCNHAAIIKEGKLIAMDSVSNLTKTNTKKVIVKGIHEEPSIPGIKMLHSENDTVHFMYQGSIKLLLTTLSNMEITDVIIEEPSLDETFMHYYEKTE
ncbi:ABC transporter ATP-binding protein [Anaeromicropila herbilytica]|uniref:ABC transporter ATP-binding protein n=1 Tax=Anaeromicropila herbilytica TaxID=2785025 RepID=A0A7R7IDN1_9FIRM|nr:ABC transporter ATP-binding protein [Anaeromicropila herbilytica]BCN30188.1 ABC transporter ATP-binding protein [Anaeromicropila herbilytica]